MGLSVLSVVPIKLAENNHASGRMVTLIFGSSTAFSSQHLGFKLIRRQSAGQLQLMSILSDEAWFKDELIPVVLEGFS